MASIPQPEPVVLKRETYHDLLQRLSDLVQHEAAAYSLLRQVSFGTPEALDDVAPHVAEWIAAYERRRGLMPQVSIADQPSTLPAEL